MNVPGLKIIAPSSPSDAKGLLRSAIDSDDPVLSFEACPLWGMKEEVDDNPYYIPLGVGRTVRSGADVTIVAISGGVLEATFAADALAAEGISVEVFDPRTLVPLDVDGILTAAAKTGRLIVVDPAHRTCGAAAEVSALVAEHGFDTLKSPIIRITTPDMQIPFSPALEKQMYPGRVGIANAVRTMLGTTLKV